MRFAQIQGNADAKKAFAGMVASGRVPHAIMLHEDDGGGGVALAVAFLQLLYCESPDGEDSCGICPSCNKVGKLIHPDLHIIFPVTAGNFSESYASEFRDLFRSNPFFSQAALSDALGIEGKSSIIAVPEAKKLLDALSMSALEGGYRSVLIYLPEKMNQEAANRLLKLIEEPPLKTQFIFVTQSPEKVLRTIASRCQLIRVLPGDMSAPLEEFVEFKSLMDCLCRKDLFAALGVSDELSGLPSREKAKSFCRYSSSRLRLMFFAQQGLEQGPPLDDDVRRWASASKKTFPRNAAAAFDRAIKLIDRNVNLKILFADLVNRLYMCI